MGEVQQPRCRVSPAPFRAAAQLATVELGRASNKPIAGPLKRVGAAPGQNSQVVGARGDAENPLEPTHLGHGEQQEHSHGAGSLHNAQALSGGLEVRLGLWWMVVLQARAIRLVCRLRRQEWRSGMDGHRERLERE